MPSVGLRWTIDAAGYAGHTIEFSPGGDSLYLSDGWGNYAYASTKVRRIDLASGKELSSARLGNLARCWSFAAKGSDAIVATDTTKLFRVDRTTLKQKERWDRRVPRSPGDIVWRGSRVAMGGWGRGYIAVFDLDSGHVNRLASGGWPLLTEVMSDILVVAADSGNVYRLELAESNLVSLFSTPQVASCAFDADEGSLWVLLGQRQIVTTYEQAVKVSRPASDRLRRYDLASAAFEESRLQQPCNILSAVGGALWAYPIANPLRRPYTPHQLSIVESGVETNILMPPGHTIMAMSLQARVVITSHDAHPTSGTCRMSCLEVS
jgi:hypothetical protein